MCNKTRQSWRMSVTKGRGAITMVSTGICELTSCGARALISRGQYMLIHQGA